MHAALRRVAQRALARAPARAPSTIARRSYASDPNAPPKVPYPWHDPTNPSNWKEEHVRVATLSRSTATRDRSRVRRDASARSIDPSDALDADATRMPRLTASAFATDATQVVFAVLGGWAVVIAGARRALS